MSFAYPQVAFQFDVDWGGARLGFSEVSGMTQETQVIEYREGNLTEHFVVKMPGMKKFGNLTFKRGIIKGDDDFKTWFNTNVLNTTERRTITIRLLDEEGNPVVVWTAKNCFPTKFEGPGLKATGNEVAIETLEVAFESITEENVG